VSNRDLICEISNIMVWTAIDLVQGKCFPESAATGLSGLMNLMQHCPEEADCL
jgi:hypothetical protein